VAIFSNRRVPNEGYVARYLLPVEKTGQVLIIGLGMQGRSKISSPQHDGIHSFALQVKKDARNVVLANQQICLILKIGT
jgi:hypothetical protein